MTPGGSNTVHIYTQTIHRTTQLTILFGRLSGIRTQSDETNWEECGLCPVFASYTLPFALQLRKKHRKTSVRVNLSQYPLYLNTNVPVHLKMAASSILLEDPESSAYIQ